jgi:hypothetical protein
MEYIIANWTLCTDKKENKTFLIFKEIQIGSGANSYMRKGFLIYEKWANFSPYMRRPLDTYDFAPDPTEFHYTVYEENLLIFFTV